ncbi:MAG: peptide deformylase [Armatimonadota bacterium]
MALNLIELDSPVLRMSATPVTDFGSRRLVRLAEEMDELRIEEGGIGLAAPQVGISERIIIVEVPDEDFVGIPNSPSIPPTVLINPEIIWESEEYIKLPEGCLSLPGMMGNVMRPSIIQVQALDLDGDAISIMADRWFARVLQHEIDHLDGILFPDRIENSSELWYVEHADLNDPIWNHNPVIQEIRENLNKNEPGESRTA